MAHTDVEKKLTIAVIDDNPVDLETLERYLTRLPGYIVAVRGYTDPERAIRELSDNDIADLIFTDYEMGGTSGLEVIRELRAAGNKQPVIVLTGQGNERLAAQTFKTGAYDYIIKDDLSPDSLRASIDEVLDRFDRERKNSDFLRDALVDELTGLYVRRYFNERTKEEFSRARRGKQPLALAVIDIDHFKTVNDTYGHLGGDRILRFVAACIEKVKRASDVAARFGGDEICVLLPGESLDGARRFAERLREAVTAHPVALEDNRHAPVTLSIGVTAYDDGMKDTDAFFERADQALYAAKKGGRNRVCASAE